MLCQPLQVRQTVPVIGGSDRQIIRGEVVTMGDDDRIITDGAVVIRGELIEAVGRWAEVSATFPDATVVGDGSGLVTPGYINAHQHLTGDRLIASCIPEAIDSREAIFDWAVPVHHAHTGDDDELSATIAAIAAVTNGITTTVEAGTVAHPHRVAAALGRVGLRTMLGTWGWDAPGVPFGAPAGEVIDAHRQLLERYPAGGLVQGWVSLVGHDLVSDELFVAAADLAVIHGTGMTFHMSPHQRDAAAYLERTGHRPLVHLQRLGVLGRHALVAHAVHLDDAEVDAVLQTDTAVASCPWAYLRLAQGFTTGGRHVDLLRRGARLAIGCDAENAGDAVDVLSAARLFVGLCRDGSGDPFVATGDDALALATRRGAEAIGMGDRLGRLVPGFQADVVVHDRRGVQFVPRSVDPVRQLIWASDGRSVSDVFIAGRRVVGGGRCVSVDLDGLSGEVQSRSAALIRAGGAAGAATLGGET